jgi:hypothetical protein
MLVVYTIGSIYVFFMNFFEVLKFEFLRGLNKRLHRGYVPKRRSRLIVHLLCNVDGCN